jgi:hypothetical protein
MSKQLNSVTAVVSADRATSALGGLWTEAYRLTAQDMASGSTTRELSDAYAKAGHKASNDLVSCYGIAWSLVRHGDVFTDAVAGSLQLPHSLVLSAKKARDIKYVRATIALLDGVEGEELVKVMKRVIRELNAKPRKTPAQTEEAESRAKAKAEKAKAEGDAKDDVIKVPATPETKGAAIIAILLSLKADLIAGKAGAFEASVIVLNESAHIANVVKGMQAKEAKASA